MVILVDDDILLFHQVLSEKELGTAAHDKEYRDKTSVFVHFRPPVTIKLWDGIIHVSYLSVYIPGRHSSKENPGDS
jgi:hypothetical protein